MDISSLVPMVTGQPNEPFLRSIGRDSAVLEELSKRWDKTTTTDRNCWPKFSIYSFYETKESPTAVDVWVLYSDT
ncbi:uncharacterized protein BKA78DRAFT_313462 [Phyllosticta capitalensis]|uniref:uncharacterized protein n=1 Tax=Phyllosticta capitalensis TaxID=121624 RepID=UPI00312D65E4